jgi:L-rhamnose-H+ transport protein
MNGSFTLPMKFTRTWAWENTWLIWTIFALGIFPPVLTLLTIPGLRTIYAETGSAPAVVAAACGAGWGISQVFLGLAVEGIGMALSFSVIMGISAAVGSLLPLVRLHPDAIFSRGGVTLLCGVALTLAGVAIAAVAGHRREAALNAMSGNSDVKLSVAKGLVFATISGLGSAVVNIGLAYAEPLTRIARQHGVAEIWSPNLIWLPLMLAGAIPNIVYCVYLIRRNRTAKRFQATHSGVNLVFAIIMAAFWFASTILYGVAATELGNLGPVLGWPIFMSLIVITATLWGVITGEWRVSGKRPLQIMSSAVAVLVVAIFVLGLSSRMF